MQLALQAVKDGRCADFKKPTEGWMMPTNKAPPVIECIEFDGFSQTLNDAFFNALPSSLPVARAFFAPLRWSSVRLVQAGNNASS